MPKALRCSVLIAVVFGAPEALPTMPGGQSNTPAPPVFHCRLASSQECAYTIHDKGGGSINLVLAGGESHGYNENVIGARYCANYGDKHQATPLWPDCLNIPNDKGHRHDTVVAGDGNG
jgi:hypothetical protein